MRVKGLPVYLSLAEVHQMLSCCEHERDRMLVKLLWHTGARISEAIAVRVGDITDNGVRMRNLKQGYWRRLADGSKEHIPLMAEKHVFCSQEFLTELRDYAVGQPPEAYLITHLAGAKPLTRKTGWLIVTRLAARAGILRRRLTTGELRPAWTHTLRHSAATNLLAQGMPVTLVQSQLGHASLASTQIYAQIADPHKARLIEEVRF